VLSKDKPRDDGLSPSDVATECGILRITPAHDELDCYRNFAYAEVGCDLLVYPRDQDRSTIAYTVELVEVSYREVVGFRAP